VLWSDEDIGIEWKLRDPPVISGRDRNLPRLRDIPAGILPEA
jgi:dTDP-4-dehydrorhamnose 3,5-epimerase-like enzyme